MPENTTETKYGVARDGALISPLYDDVDLGKQQLTHVEAIMSDVGLESDVELVTVEVKTSYGKPKTYVAPKPAAPIEEPPVEGDPTSQQ